MARDPLALAPESGLRVEHAEASVLADQCEERDVAATHYQFDNLHDEGLPTRRRQEGEDSRDDRAAPPVRVFVSDGSRGVDHHCWREHGVRHVRDDHEDAGRDVIRQGWVETLLAECCLREKDRQFESWISHGSPLIGRVASARVTSVLTFGVLGTARRSSITEQTWTIREQHRHFTFAEKMANRTTWKVGKAHHGH